MIHDAHPVPAALLGRDDVQTAAAWLRGRVIRTPVVTSAVLDRLAGARLWLKAESLQRTGSYKMRGAMLAVGRVARDGLAPGVIAQSTGNHALAVALAAREHGLNAAVVLPVDASPVKLARAEAAGARVILAGTGLDERLDMVERLRTSTGHAVVDAYDHPDVVAGQGTATLELVEEAHRRGVHLDTVVVPVGGGGGLAGACLAVRDRDTAVFGVEPVGCDSMTVSLEQGRRVPVPPAPTLADGLRPSCVGRLPFEIARSAVAGMVRVDDGDIGRALCRALFHARLVLEPSAAAGLAGAFRLAASRPGTDIGVVLTGGNVEPGLLARLVTEHGADTAAGEVAAR
jgi:threonine dehydratase